MAANSTPASRSSSSRSAHTSGPAVSLDVDAGDDDGQRQALARIGLQAAQQADGFDAIADLDPYFAQVGIDEGFELGGVALDGEPLLGDLGPGQAEADGGVEGGEVVAAGMADGGAFGDPLATGEHGGLVALLDLGTALAAHVPGGFDLRDALGLGQAVVHCGGAVFEVAPFEGLHLAAVRTGDVIAAPVGATVELIDAA